MTLESSLCAGRDTESEEEAAKSWGAHWPEGDKEQGEGWKRRGHAV